MLCSERRALRVGALLATAMLGLVTAACGGDDADQTADTSPEDRIVSNAEVTEGLADVRAKAAEVVGKLSTDPEAAAETSDAMFDSWFGFEGTVRKNDQDLYLQMEDGLTGIKAGVEDEDVDRARRGKDDLDEAAEAYLAGGPYEDAEDEGASAPGQRVPVSLTDFEVKTSSGVDAGRTSFEIDNAATQVHEFVVVKTPLAGDALPLDEDGLVDEQGAGLEFVDEVEDLEGGKSATLTVDLTSGTYVLLCNLPDHYNQGMYAPFTVS